MPRGSWICLPDAKRKGRVAAIAPLIHAMQERANFRISEALLRRVLVIAGEGD